MNDWNDASKAQPPLRRELYVVVQEFSGERVRNAAWWEQDANGEWKWNKENITHWHLWPEMPQK